MWIQVSVNNAMVVIETYFINNQDSNDTNNLLNGTPSIQMRICH